MAERRRSPWIWILLGLVVVVGLAFAIPATRVRLLGLLSGEPFHAGLPASGWAEELIGADPAQAKSSMVKGGGAAVPVAMRLAFGPDSPAREPAREVLAAIGSPAVPSLLLQFKKSPPEEKEAVLDILGKMGKAARPAVVPLAELLGDETAAGPVLKTLARMGPVAADAMPELRAALKSTAAEKRRLAALVLVEVGPEAKAALPELIDLLRKQENPATTSAVVDCLAKVGAPAVEPLRAELQGKSSPAAKSNILRALSRIGGPSEAATADIAACLDDEPATARQAAVVLGNLKASGAVPQLAAILEKGKGPRLEAAEALGKIGEVAKEAVGILAKTVRDADRKIAQAAASALIDIGPAAASAAAVLVAEFPEAKLEKLGPEAVPFLVGFLAEDKAAPDARQRAQAVCRTHPEMVLKELENKEPSRRLAAAALLAGTKGKAEEKVLPGLFAALRDLDERVCKAAETSLASFGDAMVPYLATELRGKTGTPRSAALRLVGTVGKDDRLVQPLLTCLMEKDEAVAQPAALGLLQQGVYPRPALPLLAKTALEAKGDQRVEILRAIAKYGREGRKILPDLLPLVKDPSPQVRESLARCLDAMGPPPQGLDAMLALAGDKEPAVRAAAYRGLSGAAFAKQRVLPILRKGLQEKDADLRAAALAGLAGLKNEAREVLPELLQRVAGAGGDAAAYIRTVAAIGPKDAAHRQALEKLLAEAKEPEVRAACIAALGRMGPAALESLPLLAKYAKEHPEEIATAQFHIAPTAERLGTWLDRLKEKAPQETVVRFFEEHPRDKAVPDLIRLAEGEDAKLRLAALKALSKAKDPRLHKLVPQFSRELNNPDPRMRAAVAVLLGSLGDNAQAATDRLIALYEEPYAPEVRQAAGLALLQIDPEAAELAGVLK